MNYNDSRKRIDFWETTGRFCLELSKYSIVGIGFGAFLQKDKPVVTLILIASAFAVFFAAAAIVCFKIYNRNIY